MPRTILFRGKRKDNGGWVEGFYVKGATRHVIVPHMGVSLESSEYDVSPETVGQYTGLDDKNGVKIFEGDVIELEGWTPKRNIVGFVDGGFGFKSSASEYYHSDISYVETSRGKVANVMGNIHDNKELLSE